MGQEFKNGLKTGLPVGLGYFTVSMTFGFLTVSGGLPLWVAAVISLTNLTSAGQFAGMSLILAGAGYIELALTVFIVNIRYILMSLSLSQRIDQKMTTWQRMLIAFGITDETFVLASVQQGTLGFKFMLGLMTLPIVGWNLGTIFGGVISTMLPESLQNAMGIALYAMFIAVIIPEAKEKHPVLVVILIAVAATCILKYVPGLNQISSGFRVIIATFVAAGLGARFFPKEEPVDGEVME